jgi:hypothetical protein
VAERKRKTSQRVATSPGCAPLFAMYQGAVESSPKRWTDVEAGFLKAMWEFDENFARGLADQGDNQNGKGDFFTDLIALLLENSTGKALYGRGAVPGLFFPHHNLDASYPPSGPVELVIETKAAGAPKTLRNPKQKNPRGRPGSNDLKKRVTEVGLKTIDLKAEAARMAGEGRGPAGDLVSWLRKSRPLCFLFLAIRVVDEKDLRGTIQFAQTAGRILDDVGLIAYEPKLDDSGYAALAVPPEVQLDRVLARVATALRSAVP